MNQSPSHVCVPGHGQWCACKYTHLNQHTNISTVQQQESDINNYYFPFLGGGWTLYPSSIFCNCLSSPLEWKKPLWVCLVFFFALKWHRSIQVSSICGNKSDANQISASGWVSITDLCKLQQYSGKVSFHWVILCNIKVSSHIKSFEEKW